MRCVFSVTLAWSAGIFWVSCLIIIQKNVPRSAAPSPAAKCKCMRPWYLGILGSAIESQAKLPGTQYPSPWILYRGSAKISEFISVFLALLMDLALHNAQNWKLLGDTGDESVANLTLWCLSAPQQVDAWKQLIIYTLTNEVACVLSLKLSFVSWRKD